MIEKIAHLGVAVDDLEKAISVYEDLLGLKLAGIEEAQGLRVAFLEIGQSKIELLQSTDPTNVIARFIMKNGEGLHHVALKTDNLALMLKRAAEKGYQLVDHEPRPGAGGTRIAFIHPKSTHGVLIELVEEGAHNNK